MKYEPRMTFGEALAAMQAGRAVERAGWNGKHMWIELSETQAGDMYKDLPLRQHIMMKTAQNDYVPWVASQTDLLASDWGIVR
jgi:hypothetical protein